MPPEIARRILRVEVAPALERPVRARLDQDHRRLEHEVAAPDPLPVRERPHRDERLPAGELALDDPVERAAVDELVHALRHHAGGVRLLVGAPEPPVMRAVLLDPLLEIGDRIAADAKLEEVEGHGPR
jgi:hypothetical protein